MQRHDPLVACELQVPEPHVPVDRIIVPSLEFSKSLPDDKLPTCLEDLTPLLCSLTVLTDLIAGGWASRRGSRRPDHQSRAQRRLLRGLEGQVTSSELAITPGLLLTQRRHLTWRL